MEILNSALELSFTSIGFALLALSLTCAYIYFVTRRPKNFPPGPPVLPVVGSLPFMNSNQGEYIYELVDFHDKYGDVYSIKLGSIWVYVVKTYDDMKELFVKRGQDFAGRPTGDIYPRLKTMYPDGNQGIVLGDYDEQWKLQRHTSMTILRNLGYGKNRLQEIITEEVEELCKVITNKEGETIDLCDLINVSIANVICALLFGERYDHTDKEFAYLRKCVDEGFEMMDELMTLDFLPFLRFLPHYRRKLAHEKKLNQHLDDVMRKKIKARAIKEEGEPRDFIEGYLRALKENKNMEDRSLEITEDFFQAGMETTTSPLGWAVYYMLKHPEIQAKVQEELDKVVGQSRGVTLKDKENLPYTEACVAEVTRLACTAPMTLDHKALVDSEFRGHRIPKGTLIWGNLWAVLRNPEVFPEPEAFRPERFIQDDGTFKRHEHLITFGIGRRSCLGEQLARQELFLFFSHILQKFKLSVPDGHTHPPPKGIFAFTCRPPVFKVVAQNRK